MAFPSVKPVLPPVVTAPHPHEKHQREMGIPQYSNPAAAFDRNDASLSSLFNELQRSYELSRRQWRILHPARDIGSAPAVE